MPKPIFLTHGFLGALINAISLPLPKGRSTVMPQRIHSDDLLLVTTPFYHIMGFISFILSVFYGLPFLIPPDKPVSPELATDMLLTTKPTAAVFAPYILEQMSLLSSSMDALSTLRFIYFGGAPLSRAAGEKISGRSNLVNFLGSSETGFIPSMIPEERQNWEYFEWNPNYGLRMEPIGRNLFELIIPRPKRRDFHAIFHTYPKSREYHTNDLFTPHPTQPDLWKYQGRLDDTIVLTNGEKVNPILMEKTIEDHPLVSRAVIVGQNRFQTALLIEPNWEKWNEKAGHLVDQIWPTVQQANRLYPGHAHIMRNKICLASRNKPFETTPKGSTQRRRVLLDYMQEIDAVYAGAGDSTIVDALPWDSSLSDVTRFVQRTVSELLPQKVSEQDDLFAAGLDSGQAVYLSEILRGAASFPVDAKRAIMLQTVYANPTVQQLSSTIHSVLHGHGEKQPYRELKIRTILQKYASDIPERIPGSVPFDNVHTVILTGSTGSLGSYILSKLIKDPQVAKVYCLNRSVAREKQIASFREKGLSFDCYELAKMEFLQVDLSQKMFGLRSDIYDELLHSVDTIIHNAWMVDFNHPVDSFEPHISGLRRFVDFSVQSAHNAHILFASSISTVGAWKSTLGPVVPEVPLEDCDVVVRQGYGESKHIGERICLEASRRAGVPTTIIRFGQIAGPTTEMGIWNRHEWLPAMITSSKAMGKIPKTLGSMRVDWIPVVSDSLTTVTQDSRPHSDTLTGHRRYYHPRGY
jgi:nucleoside-diphosphate-sugar epimerase/aryl carrier-like protein